MSATRDRVQFVIVPGGMRREHVIKTHKGEQWAFVAHVNALLSALRTHVQKVER